MEAFIKKHGVTKCPGMGTAELAERNAEMQVKENGRTYQEKRQAWANGRRPRRKSALTPEQRRERINAYQRARYARLKGKK